MNPSYERLRHGLDGISMVNAHDHTRDRERVLAGGLDLVHVCGSCNLKGDLISAGIDPNTFEIKDIDPAEAWQILRPWMDVVRCNGYYRTLMLAARDLYGFADTEITEDNWRALYDAMVAGYQRPDWYRHVYKEKARFDVHVIDQSWNVGNTDVDRTFFVPVLKLDPFLYGGTTRFITVTGKSFLTTVQEVAARWSASIKTFEDYCALIELAFRKNAEGGGVGVKVAAAYERSIVFDKVSKDEAARIFKKKEADRTVEEARRFENFVMHFGIEQCRLHGIPMQIHTGFQAGNRNYLTQAHPLNLTNLFFEYPDVRFVLLHGAYPYHRELGYLAKSFPNVFLDCSWMQTTAPSALKEALHEWLEFVNPRKYMWGADCNWVEFTYGASVMFKNVLAEVLAEKVDRGQFALDVAEEVGQHMLRDNAWSFFELDRRR